MISAIAPELVGSGIVTPPGKLETSFVRELERHIAPGNYFHWRIDASNGTFLMDLAWERALGFYSRFKSPTNWGINNTIDWNSANIRVIGVAICHQLFK